MFALEPSPSPRAVQLLPKQRTNRIIRKASYRSPQGAGSPAESGCHSMAGEARVLCIGLQPQIQQLLHFLSHPLQRIQLAFQPTVQEKGKAKAAPKHLIEKCSPRIIFELTTVLPAANNITRYKGIALGSLWEP